MLSEAHLQRVWSLQALRSRILLTEEGGRVEVLFPGLPGLDGGPDFRGACLRIGGDTVIGDVEIHRTPSGWRAHGHESDGAYSGVVLHVVLDRDASPHPPGPMVVLRPYLNGSIARISRGTLSGSPPERPNQPMPFGRAGPAAWPQDPAKIGALLESAGRVRWERRRRRFAREADRAGEEEAMHRAFLTALGYRRNRGPFRELARLVPASQLRRMEEAEIRRKLEQAAERIPFWRRRGVRPVNAPRNRIVAAARILARGPVLESLRHLRDAVALLTQCGGLGRERAQCIFLHAVLPGLGESPGMRILRHHSPLPPNRREVEALSLLPPSASAEVTSVLRQLGLLEIRDSLESHPSSVLRGCELI